MDVDDRMERERKGGAAEESHAPLVKEAGNSADESTSFKLNVAPATNSTSLSIDAQPSVLPEKYDSVGELKQGQLGQVFKAKKVSNGEAVAVRMMPRIDPVNPLVATRFKDRCATLARLAHPAIVVPKDFGINDQMVPYLVTPFVEEATLRQLLDVEGGLEQERAMDCFVQVAEALAHAHSMKVDHGNLTSENVFVGDVDGCSSQVSVSDFGLDALFQGRQFDPKDDVYAFGALMYEVLTSHKPTIRAANSNPAEGSTISTELQNIILFCLNPDPRYRYADGSEVLENLLRIRQGKVPSPPANRPGQKLMSPLVLGMVTGTVVILTIGVYLFASHTRSTNVVSPASAPSIQSDVEMTRNNGTAPYQFPAANSNIQGALNAGDASLSKDTIKHAATLGAVGGAVIYQSMSESDRQQAAKAAAGSAAGAWQKWKSMDPQEKGAIKHKAAGLFGKAARLWKNLPDN